jgi:isoleucyl-tRNA synthetase
VAQSDYTADLRIGKEILKGTADSYRRLRNTFRFMLGALNGWDGTPVAAADMPEPERWMLHRLAEMDATVRSGYAAYDFQGVFQSVFTFATSDLSAFYFDVRKDALYCDPIESQTRRACLVVMDALFHRLTTWLAPLLPFTMEDVWLSRFPSDGDSIHLHDFPQTPADWLNPELATRMAALRALRRVVTGALEVERRAKTIGASLEAAPVVYLDAARLSLIHDPEDFATLCITSGITVTGAPAPDGAFTDPDVPGVAVAFAMAEGQKCGRCWKILPDVGSHTHPGTCARCSDALG